MVFKTHHCIVSMIIEWCKCDNWVCKYYVAKLFSSGSDEMDWLGVPVSLPSPSSDTNSS